MVDDDEEGEEEVVVVVAVVVVVVVVVDVIESPLGTRNTKVGVTPRPLALIKACSWSRALSSSPSDWLCQEETKRKKEGRKEGKKTDGGSEVTVGSWLCKTIKSIFDTSQLIMTAPMAIQGVKGNCGNNC